MVINSLKNQRLRINIYFFYTPYAFPSNKFFMNNSVKPTIILFIIFIVDIFKIFSTINIIYTRFRFIYQEIFPK